MNFDSPTVQVEPTDDEGRAECGNTPYDEGPFTITQSAVQVEPVSEIVNHEEALSFACFHPESNLARCYIALSATQTVEPFAYVGRHVYDTLAQCRASTTTMTKHIAFDDDVALYATPQQGERLTAERDAALVDAKRYRWLRDPCNPVHVAYYSRGDYGKGLFTGTLLDEAIDEALTKEKI